MTRKTLQNIHKAELHRHLDGSIRFETILDLCLHHNLDLGTDEELRQKTKITSPMKDLASVLDSFHITQKVLCSYEAIRRVTFENVEDAWRDGVRLIELRFAPLFIAQGKAIRNDEIIEGVLDGITLGMEKYPIQAGLIGILPRTLDLKKNDAATNSLLHYKQGNHKNSDRICGFDLADDELENPHEDFVPMVNRARKGGLGITVHTGENTDVQCIEKSLDLYNPQRIGHGIKVWGDKALNKTLIDRIKKAGIMLEICPTSNWLTNSVPSFEEHPLPDLFRNGVLVSINSDDPHLMDISLVDEYEKCAKYFDFDLNDFLEMNRNAVSSSFLDEDIKRYVLKFF